MSAAPQGTIQTYGLLDGIKGPTGWLLPIWSDVENPEEKVSQVYLTVVAPGAVKGPHCHRQRAGRFTCIKGNVRIVLRHENVFTPPLGGFWYETYDIGEHHGFGTIRVAPRTAAAIYNLGSKAAYVLNLPHPAWRADQQDEWPVDNWTYRP
jgi:dTDP-4-dehydrorhamnose 3,5-epimerase-like enzyme